MKGVKKEIFMRDKEGRALLPFQLQICQDEITFLVEADKGESSEKTALDLMESLHNALDENKIVHESFTRNTSTLGKDRIDMIVLPLSNKK